MQCARVLLAACNSFDCSVVEFCLQCAGVLFAACNSFACSVHLFFFTVFVCSMQEMIFFDVLFMFARFFYLQCGPPYIPNQHNHNM